MSYLFAAYLIIWILIFGYTLLLGRRQKQTREELEILNNLMKRKA